MRNFSKIFRFSVIFCLLYSVAAAVVLLTVVKLSFLAVVGILIGTAGALVNLLLLLFTFRQRIDRGRPGLAAGCYVIRLFIYASLAILCMKIGTDCLIAYAAGVLGIVPGLLLGVLAARRAGREIREDVAEKKDELEARTEETKARVEERVEEKKEQLEEKKEAFEEKITR